MHHRLLATAAVFLCWAFYGAWVKEYERAEQELAKNALPELSGHIQQALIGVPTWKESGSEHFSLYDSVIALDLAIFNKRQMSPVTVKDFSLEIEVDGNFYRGARTFEQSLLRNVLVHFGDPEGSMLQVSIRTECIGDIGYLRSRSSSWIALYVKNLKCVPDMKARITVTVFDVLDCPHIFPTQESDLVVGRLTCGT